MSSYPPVFFILSGGWTIHNSYPCFTDTIAKFPRDIESIIKQVERYKILVNQLQSNIEKEFNQAYFLTGYHFKNIISIVLAPKIFYSNKSKGLKTYKQNNIIFTYFKDRQIKNKHLKTNLGKPTVISVIK
jgi:hypothetical protein